MVGCEKKVFKRYESLFRDLSLNKQHTNILQNVGMLQGGGWYASVGKSGAGHFVKMVHNGIEYGMMQSLAEGFHVMKQSKFRLNLKEIARLYNQGSVIESRLVGWLLKAYEEHGEDLKDISGEVAQSGEGLWTVETAKELGVPVEIIKKSLEFRLKSKGNQSYTGQVISALRNQFGRHDVQTRT